jgi:hypothetical protein
MKSGKQPVIRPGQHHPYYKGSQSEIDQRRGYVMRLLIRGVPKMMIHGVIKDRFNRQWRTVDRDIAFVTRLGNTWLTRARAGHHQNSLSEMIGKLKFICGDGVK